MKYGLQLINNWKIHFIFVAQITCES